MLVGADQQGGKRSLLGSQGRVVAGDRSRWGWTETRRHMGIRFGGNRNFLNTRYKRCGEAKSVVRESKALGKDEILGENWKKQVTMHRVSTIINH